MPQMVLSIADMQSSIGALGDSIVGLLTDVNELRNTGVLLVWITLAGLCFFTLVNIWVAMLCSKFRRKGGIKACFGTFTFLMVIILLVLFVVCSLLYTVTTIVSDFCMVPDESMENALDAVSPGSRFTYFMDCDTNSDAAVSPFKQETDLAMAGIEAAVGQVSTFVDYMEATVSPATQGDFDTVHPLAVDTLASLRAVQTALGGGGGDKLNKGCNDPVAGLPMEDGLFGDVEYCLFGTEQTNGQGYTDGAFSAFSCYAANSRYQGFANALCGDFHSSVARSFELFIAAGVFMILMEVARRFTRAEDEDKDDEEEEGEDGEGNWGGSDKQDTAVVAEEENETTLSGEVTWEEVPTEGEDEFGMAEDE